MVPAHLDDDEWQLVRASPWVVAVGVMMADPSGVLGRRNELASLLAQVRATAEEGSISPLVHAVASDLVGDSLEAAVESSGLGDPDGGLPARALARSREVATLVATRRPDEAGAFCAWLLELAGGVARSTREGGVLGFGGEAVSAAESAFLSELAVALDHDAAGAPGGG